MSVLQLNNQESGCALKLATRPAGTYRVEYSLLGNGLYSSLFVKSVSAGATLSVAYFDKGLGGGFGEKIPLGEHTEVTDATALPFSDQVCLSKYHSAPFLEAVVTGGSVEFGVFSTVTDVSFLETLVENGELPVTGPSGPANNAKTTEVIINNTGWTPLPAIPVAGRKSVSVQNFTGGEVKLSFQQPVGYVGTALPNGSERFYSIDETLTLYARSELLASATIVIEEMGNV